MKILMTAYSCQPGRGAEEGVGWNLARQVALRNKCYLITRENNVDAIKAAAEREGLTGLTVVGYDLPPWARFWKRKHRGAVLYFYLWTLFAGLQARRLNRTIDFDLVHSTTFVSSWIPTGLILVNRPLVWGPVGQHPRIPNQFLRGANYSVRIDEAFRALVKATLLRFDPLLRRTMRSAAVILSLGSEFERQRLPSKTAPMVRIHAVGVEAVHEPIKHDGFNLLFAGRLVELKGARLALLAFAHAQRTDPALNLTFLGDGPLRGTLETLADELGVSDVVHFEGKVPFEDVTSFFRRSDVFLFPSFEGAGMVVPEAMASGAVVVCLDFGGPGDMTIGGRGLRCEVGESEQATALGLAEAIAQLRSKPDLMASIRERARTWIEAEMLWDRKGEQIQSIYEGVLEREGRSV